MALRPRARDKAITGINGAGMSATVRVRPSRIRHE